MSPTSTMSVAQLNPLCGILLLEGRGTHILTEPIPNCRAMSYEPDQHGMVAICEDIMEKSLLEACKTRTNSIYTFNRDIAKFAKVLTHLGRHHG